VTTRASDSEHTGLTLADLWSTGSARRTAETGQNDASSWSITVCGDWAPQPGRHQETIADDPISYYGDLLPVLRRADFTLVNLECPIVERPAQVIVKDGDTMYAPPQTIAGLTAIPFSVACLANNHILDAGAAGLRETMDLLQRHGIATVGAGECAAEAERPLIMPIGDVSLALLNVAEGEEARAAGSGAGAASLDLERVTGQIRCLRTQADVVMVIVHAGREYLPVPAPHIQRAYRALIDAGADLVVGHHPHVPQGIELHCGKPIAYSLGNFAFDMDTPPVLHRRGYDFNADFRGRELVQFDIHPYEIREDGLRLLNSVPRSEFLIQLGMLSEIAADTDRLEQIWDAYSDRWLRSSGTQELIDSVAEMVGCAPLMRACLWRFATRFTGKGVTDRALRRALWNAIGRLDRHIEQSELNQDSTRAAAVLRNRFDTTSHRELYLTALERVMNRRSGQSAERDEAFLAEAEVFW
jgi:hypothetical protein